MDSTPDRVFLLPDNPMTASPLTNPFVIKLTESGDPVVMEFRWIPPGWFRMGQRGKGSSEEPPTWVRITQGFYMGVLPVTIQQHNALVSKKERKKGDDKLPVTEITWRQSKDLCRILNERCNKQLEIEGVQYECTLPTEVQWEYACRAGADTEVCFGEGIGSYRERIQRGEYLSQDELVWYTDNSNGHAPRDPRQGIPNPFGLQECHGNVGEWCQDRWDEVAYRRFHSGIDDSQALELSELLGNHEDDSVLGEFRVRRGGSFISAVGNYRAAYRIMNGAGCNYWIDGLRVCLVPSPDSGKQAKRASTDESDQARRQAAADPDEHGDASRISNAPAMPACEFLELSGPPVPPPVPIRCIESKDGKTWHSNLGKLDFYQTAKQNPTAFANVTKLVLGNAPSTENNSGRISLEALPSDLESLFPNLTHLYLWQIDSLTQLPRLPANMQVLDLRGCRNLANWGDQPHINSWALHLEELFLDHTQLPDLEINDIPTFPNLIELSFRGCDKISGLFIKDMIGVCPALRFLDLSGCLQLVESLPDLPSDLRVLNLNGCSNLERLPNALPSSLRRLELKGASKLRRLPLIPARMDLLDLRETTSLRTMPTFEWHSLTEPLPNSDPVPIETWDPNQRTWPNSQWIVQHSTPRPRTLYLNGSGIERNLDLEGDSEDENVAVSVHLDLLEKDFVAYRDIKVILLGNGRCGKSSLARLLQNGTFDEFQPTTHGIMLWKLSQQLTPIANDRSPDAQLPTAQLNVWDFAGQDLYHGTHRLFLQHNAIYIVLDSPPDLPGANEASDATEREQEELERSWGFGDQPRSPFYWHRMIESLGTNPLTQQPPPVLFVRSKVDRYSAQESSRSFPPGVDTVSISAKSIAEILAKIGSPNPMDLAFETLQPKGLSPTEQALFAEFQSLIRWIRQKVRSLLGPFERHRIPRSAMAVVDEIKKLATENDRAYEQHQKSIAFASDQPSVCQSPKPYISVDKFNAWVRQHCEHYSQRPEELLKRFHRSGLVYYDPQYLENDIVIDQRWAIHGIYALFDRSRNRSVLPSIRSEMVTIAWSELSECWRGYGYSESAHRLFGNFMQSCGLFFELLTKEESVRDEPLLSFPSFYPTREERLARNNDDRRQSIPSIEKLDVLEDSQPVKQIVFESISESEVRSILSGLGAQWSRSLHGYRWGCTIKRAEPGRSVFWMDWERNQEDQYLHRLVLGFYYQLDEEFVAWIRETFETELCRSKGWSKETFAKHWPVSRSPEFNEIRGPSLRRLKDERMREAVRVYVAFSYAGSGPPLDANAEPATEYRPSPWLGQIPCRIAQELKDRIADLGYEKLVFYQDEDTDKPQQLSALIEVISKSDAMVVFISRKYLMISEYCMSELIGEFLEAPRDCFSDKQVLFFDMVEKYDPNHPVGSFRFKSEAGGWNYREWQSHWVKRLEQLVGGNEAFCQIQSLADMRRAIAHFETQIFQESKFNSPLAQWWSHVWLSESRGSKLESLFRELANHSKVDSILVPDVGQPQVEQSQIDESVQGAIRKIEEHLRSCRPALIERREALDTLDRLRDDPS